MEPQIHDELLGEFTYDDGLGWYEGTASWAGEAVSLSISAQDPTELPGALETARRLLAQAETLSPRLVAVLVDELLPLKNDEWFDPEHDAEPYNCESFAAPLRLEGITAFPDGSAEFFFDDGGLFFGHTLIATFDSTSGEIEATLAG